ncbi:MAG: ABC transporter ATP-binding protein [Spirochaetaceae bacterium]|jgi:ABC-2 type transport system ATP-binding protein|nr:ABC transporter ATP-binding protein [Spirochaetaceae bacterium]
MLRVSDLHWNYSSKEALGGIEFQIHRGEIVGLLGDNGAGKSTLLKCLSGILTPRGTMELKNLSQGDSPHEFRGFSAFLPENFTLYPHRIMGEYIESQAAIYSHSKSSYVELVQQLGLEKYMNQSMGQLSRGYAQRVAILITLLQNPYLLLLDEPFSGLDTSQILQLRKTLIQGATNRITLISSHILPELYQLCGRILILKQGKLAGDYAVSEISDMNELEEIYQRESLKAEGIDTPGTKYE